MTWAPLLLADPSPVLRRLVLRELLQRSEEDKEVCELADLQDEDPLIHDVLASQDGDGSWSGTDLPGNAPGGTLQATAQALVRLGYLGLGPEHPTVRKGAEFLFSAQREDGSWPLPERREESDEREGYSMIPLQTAMPLRGLAACGFAADPRAERAYEWLLSQRLSDGAWPTGLASGNYGYVAGYRRLAHSRWGCRSNTTGALICLALHPTRCSGAEAQRALDLLLGRETRDAYALGFDLARLLGAEPMRGFITYHARFDLAQVLDLCARIGATESDSRVADLVGFIKGLQGPHGLWEHPAHPQVSRWLTFDLLRSLSRLEADVAWVSTEPRTPFSAYSRLRRRY